MTSHHTPLHTPHHGAEQASQPLVHLAVGCSVGAGLIHAAAAGSHNDLRTLSLLFAVAAVLQLGWAAAALSRPARSIVLLGAVLNLGMIATWVASRTVGIGWVEGLDGSQNVGLQDSMAIGLEGVAVVAAVVASRAPVGGRLMARIAPVVGAIALIAALPAMATPHDHGDDDHGDDGHDSSGEVVAATDRPESDDPHGDAHDLGGAADPEVEALAIPTDLVYPTSFYEWIHDPTLTEEQQTAAEELIVDTTEGMAAFPDEAAVQAAGYVSIGDGVTGWEHYINLGFITDDATLDPNRIESIVLKVNPDGTKQVASAMYLLGFDTTMDDVPEIAGDLTQWHDHQNLCWEGVQVVGTTDATGSCLRGEFRATQPMMHVWMIDHPCGPFAGIEGSHGSGCGHDDHS